MTDPDPIFYDTPLAISVRLSIRRTPVLRLNEWTYPQAISTIW